jgi:hypothetical protein
VLFHFQFEGPSGWEALGSGEGPEDDDPGFEQAVADLDTLTGGLEPGRYRAIPGKGRSTRWREFRVDDRGSIAVDEESDDGGEGPAGK